MAESVREWIGLRVFPESARARMLQGFEAGPAEVDVDDAAEYAGACLGALESGRTAWCLNPKWGDVERAEARELIAKADGAAPGLRLATGGTGGRVKFVRHTRDTLAAAVSGFSRYAGDRLTGTGGDVAISAVQALPCCHVSGLMPVVRAWLTGGELTFMDGSMRGELPPMPGRAGGITVVSLVSTQLHRLLERADGAAWLRGAGLVLAGGSAISGELLDRARAARVPLGVSYGMTECAALVALYPPSAFLAGDSPVAGELLPHAEACITGEGRVALRASSLGADVPRDAGGWYVTGDEGFLDTRGRLVVTGRADRIVVCGGEKVDPKETEAVLLASGLVREALVVAVPDAEWGRALVAFVTPVKATTRREELIANLTGLARQSLSPARRPKRVFLGESLPLDARGKPDHARIAALLL